MIDLQTLLINLFNGSMMVYTFYLFADYFAEKRFIRRLHYSLLITTGIMLTLFLTFAPMGMVRTLLVCLIALLVTLLFKMKWYNHILLSMSLVAFASVCEFAVTVLISICFSVDTRTATSGPFMILGIIISKMVMMLILSIMKISKYRFSYSLSAKRSLILLLIPLSTTLISVLHINLFVKFHAESQTLIYSSLISYVVLILSNIIVFQLIDNSYKEIESEKRLAAVTELLHTQTEQYEQMQKHNHQVAKMRHDQKNFVLGLLSVLESGDQAAAKALLKKELDILIKPDEYDFNSIISAVVKAKSDLAKQHGIDINFKYSELHKIQIPAVDIAIILGNALDNAIESTQETDCVEKAIHLIVKISQELIVIIIKNPTKKPVNTADLISAKRNDGSRGFGISGIKELAKKYDGEAIFKCEDLIFETNIVMRNKSK